MPQMKQINIRLSSTQLRLLKQLAKKLQIDRTNVIRLAITRLAEGESLEGDSRNQRRETESISK